MTTVDGVVLHQGLKYVETINNEDEISLIFSYPLVGEATSNSGRIKIKVSSNVTQLAIFNEAFTDTSLNVSDQTPPPLTLNYTKMGMVHSSILDVNSIIKIDSTEITFARRIDNVDTRAQIEGIQGIDTEDIDLIAINDNTETAVTFAYTDDADIARKYYFDLIRIKNTIDNTTIDGTLPASFDYVYRQLFVCVKPKTSDGSYCTADTYSKYDLFNVTEHAFNFGTVMYLANKQPVDRANLSESEQFTILI